MGTNWSKDRSNKCYKFNYYVGSTQQNGKKQILGSVAGPFPGAFGCIGKKFGSRGMFWGANGLAGDRIWFITLVTKLSPGLSPLELLSWLAPRLPLGLDPWLASLGLGFWFSLELMLKLFSPNVPLDTCTAPTLPPPIFVVCVSDSWGAKRELILVKLLRGFNTLSFFFASFL